MWERGGTWHARVRGAPARSDVGAIEVSAPAREECLDALRRRIPAGAALTVDVLPALVGVAEAAAILGWDKRRIFTYLSRGSFPPPYAMLASGRVWLREDVERFAATRRPRGAP